MKFERILVLSDLSESSHAGLKLADSLAHRFHARVTVANVHTAGALLGRLEARSMSNDYRVAAWHRADCEKSLQALAQHRIDALRLEPVEMLDNDSVRVGIAELIRKVKPDLVCMATHGRTGIKHVLLGSVAEHTIRTAGVPVILTRGVRELGRDRPLKVMLALDLFNEPDEIVAKIASLLTPGDTLMLAHVVESAFLPLGAYGPSKLPDAAILTEAAKECLSVLKVPKDGPALSTRTRAEYACRGREAGGRADRDVEHTRGRPDRRTHARTQRIRPPDAGQRGRVPGATRRRSGAGSAASGAGVEGVGGVRRAPEENGSECECECDERMREPFLVPVAPERMQHPGTSRPSEPRCEHPEPNTHSHSFGKGGRGRGDSGRGTRLR